MKSLTPISVMIFAYIAIGCVIGAAMYFSRANVLFAIVVGATYAILASVAEVRRRRKTRRRRGAS